MGPSTLDLVGGFGSTSTSWDSLIPYTLSGGQAVSLRALLTLPVSSGLSILGSFSMTGTDRGALKTPYNAGTQIGYWAHEKVGMVELGLRVRL